MLTLSRATKDKHILESRERHILVMLEKDNEDKGKGKGKEPQNEAPLFSKKQVAFLCQLLNERETPPPLGKGKEPKKTVYEAGKSGEYIAPGG